MSEEAMREEVAQAVEVAANKAAEEEISKLAEFESAIDETLAANAKNPAILSSERIWLTAFQVGLNFGGKL